MKKLGLCLMAGMLCLITMSIAGGQQDAGKGKASSGDLPGAVCQAIEQYISKVDSGRSLKAKTNTRKNIPRRKMRLQKSFNGMTSLLCCLRSQRMRHIPNWLRTRIQRTLSSTKLSIRGLNLEPRCWRCVIPTPFLGSVPKVLKRSHGFSTLFRPFSFAL